jgi:hypothetical protein
MSKLSFDEWSLDNMDATWPQRMDDEKTPTLPLPDRCKWHAVREGRADYDAPTDTDALRAPTISPKEAELQHKALMSLKRQMPAWPLCNYGGNVTIFWAYGHAVWQCSECGRTR